MTISTNATAGDAWYEMDYELDEQTIFNLSACGAVVLMFCCCLSAYWCQCHTKMAKIKRGADTAFTIDPSTEELALWEEQLVKVST